jgi:cation transport protein ChaC
MLTRKSIYSGDYLHTFELLPQDIRWTQSEIEASLNATLGEKQNTGDIWVFAYGSLIWNPLIDFAEQQLAYLNGWHRSFCLKLLTNSSKINVTGRMLALEEGGSTSGVAYRISKEKVKDELLLVWIREMAVGSYTPIWIEIELEVGSTASAITFVADQKIDQYQSNSDARQIAPMIASASGLFGKNTEYLFKLESALIERGLTDKYVAELCKEVRNILYRTNELLHKSL